MAITKRIFAIILSLTLIMGAGALTAFAEHENGNGYLEPGAYQGNSNPEANPEAGAEIEPTSAEIETLLFDGPWTVRFHLNINEDRGPIIEFTVTDGDTAPDPIRVGYTFLGWIHYEDLNILDDLEDMGLEIGDIVLSEDSFGDILGMVFKDWDFAALWEPDNGSDNFTVTFYIAPGIVYYSNNQLEYGDTVIPPAINPTNAPQYFHGWNNAAGQPAHFPFVVTEDLTYHAVWGINPPDIASIVISPSNPSMQAGTTQGFTAIIVDSSGANTPHQGVLWSVDNPREGVSIVGTGSATLTIASGASLNPPLTVRATSIIDSSISGSTIVTVLPIGGGGVSRDRDGGHAPIHFPIVGVPTFGQAQYDDGEYTYGEYDAIIPSGDLAPANANDNPATGR